EAAAAVLLLRLVELLVRLLRRLRRLPIGRCRGRRAAHRRRRRERRRGRRRRGRGLLGGRWDRQEKERGDHERSKAHPHQCRTGSFDGGSLSTSSRSPSSTCSEGTRYSSLIHLPRSIVLQRGPQKGKSRFSLRGLTGFSQIGQELEGMPAR